LGSTCCARAAVPLSPARGGRLRPDATGSIGALIGEVGFAADSLVEGTGFEPLVPQNAAPVPRARSGREEIIVLKKEDPRPLLKMNGRISSAIARGARNRRSWPP
jgi:hypothetical protein